MWNQVAAECILLIRTYAFFNLTFPPDRTRLLRPRRWHSKHSSTSRTGRDHQIPLQPYSNLAAQPDDTPPWHYRARTRQNEGRSRLTFALLVFLTFGLISLAGAVVGSALIGYVLAGLYDAGKYNMST